MYQQLMLFNPDEQWRDVPGYEGVYQVSNLGRIKATHPRYSGSDIKNQYLLKTGYFQVDLYLNKHRAHYRVHDLVMLAFIGHKPKGFHVNHIDGVKTNNRLDNLEYVTPQENRRHALKVLHVPTACGESKPNHRFKNEDIVKIREMWASGLYRMSDIGLLYGVSKGHISLIVSNKIWKHVQRNIKLEGVQCTNRL